jgi:hypothetical protein
MLIHLCRAALRMPMEKCMPQHRPTLVPTIFALLSLAASCAASARTVHAAECIAKPNAPAPQGEHWYYRTDRATKRQCWYLGPEGASVQTGATQASVQPASDALAQLAAPQRAHRPTAPQSAQRPPAPEPTAAPAVTEANVPAPAALLPWPEASKLPDVPPAFEPTPALAEPQQSVDAIDPPPTSTSNPAEESQSPANARSSPAAAPAQATADADHTFALVTIALAALVISGSVFHATRWLDRHKAHNRHRLEWPHPSTLNAPHPRAPVDLDSVTAARHIPPPPKPLDETERLTQTLLQILNELQTKHHVLQPRPSTLSRSSRPPIAAATRSDLIGNRVSWSTK